MINIMIGDKTKKAMALLRIVSYPFTETELKAKYRNLAKTYHSDRTGGNDTIMKEINVAYSHIKHLAINEKDVIEKGKNILRAEQKNEDRFEFFDTCQSCKGTGEIVKHHKTHIEPCRHCTQHASGAWYRYDAFPTGKIQVHCRTCHGSGKFKQRNGKIVDCYRCEGRSWLTIKCPECHGSRIIVIKAHTTTSRCYKCSGSGRIKSNPFNPVIRKGAVL